MAEVEPIYSLNAEIAVIGGCVVENSNIDQARKLSPSDFYNNINRELFKLILSMDDKNKLIDLISIDEEVEKGSPLDYQEFFAYLADTTQMHIASRNIQSSINIVLDYSLRRQMVTAMNNANENLENKSSIDLANDLQLMIDTVANKTSTGDVLGIDDLITLSINKMEESQSDVRVGISTGFDFIDERLGYKALAIGEVTAIGALSKNGKTLIMNTISANCELLPDEVGHVFSIEMPIDGMFNAVVSAMTGVPADFYCRQNFYLKNYGAGYSECFAKWGKAVQELKKSDRLTFDGKKDVDADYICANIKKRVAHSRSKGKKLKLVFIDHFHRMDFHTGAGAMTYAMRDAIRKIKNTAADLGIAVVLLVQLNNRAEGQDPTSFHILDSSSIRHEIQAFMGTRLYRQNGSTVFGIYFDSQRYASMETKFDPVFMQLEGGKLKRTTNFIPMKDGE